MDASLPAAYLVRHGQTAWSHEGRHTGLTDLPLTETGRREARELSTRLSGVAFQNVLASPLQRAKSTCELAGFGASALVEPDLVEWNYGDYEGLRTAEIQKQRPGWQIFRDGCPNGESVDDIKTRADRVITKLRLIPGNTLVFSSAHFLRALAARWLGLEVAAGRMLVLQTASISVLGYEHSPREPAIIHWNSCVP